MVKQIPGGTTKKYLTYHISKNNRHSKKRFPAFHSSSQGLSNDIIFLSDFTKNYSTFWWRHQLWRHNLTFCHNFQIKINWRTKKAHLPNSVQKYIDQANIAFMKNIRGVISPLRDKLKIIHVQRRSSVNIGGLHCNVTLWRHGFCSSVTQRLLVGNNFIVKRHVSTK